MREDQVDRIAQALENLANQVGAIAASQQPAYWLSPSDEAELTQVRARIEAVGRTASDLSMVVEQLRIVGQLEERHTQELLDATNELIQLRMREKALRSNIALNNPASSEAIGLP